MRRFLVNAWDERISLKACWNVYAKDGVEAIKRAAARLSWENPRTMRGLSDSDEIVFRADYDGHGICGITARTGKGGRHETD